MPPDGTKFLVAIAIRTLVVLIALVIGLRTIGKRQTGQYNIFDIALIMLLANAVQNAMTNGDGHLLTGIVSAGTLLLMGWILQHTFRLLPALGQHVTGSSTLLLNNGRFLDENLRREGVGRDEVLAVMRQHGLCELGQVRMAVLEVDGTISIVPTNSPFRKSARKVRRSRR